MHIPETKYAVGYLRARGIALDVALDLGVEVFVKGSHSRGIYRSRLGFDVWDNKMLPDLVEESIWFPCLDAQGNIQSYFCRLFPALTGKEGETVKFLTSKNGNGFSFVPPSVWQVASKPAYPLFLTEGPVKAISVLQAGGLPIGLGGVWLAVCSDDNFRTDLHPFLRDNFKWRGRKVYLGFDADFQANPSVRHALIRTMIVYAGYGVEITVVRWPQDEGKGIDDFLVRKSGGAIDLPKLLEEMCQASVPLSEILRPVDLEQVELELCRSHLKSATVEQICRAAAGPLGVRGGTLLEEVARERGKQATANTSRLPPNVVPRPLAEILASIIGILNLYVVFPLPEEQPVIVALWVLHSWLFAAFDYTPYLFVYSPVFRSGKSRLFEVLNILCRNSELTFGATTASLLRLTGETNPPTFLLDELDTVFSRRSQGPEIESLRQFFNAGFKRGSTFLRCVFKGKEILTQKFPAFSPKALAANKQCLPSTVTDRSIPIELERQGKKRKADKFRDREYRQSVQSLLDELEVLSLDLELLEVLNKARPEMPEQLNDRQQDISEPLLAIADHAGDWKTTDPKTGKEITVKWSEKARQALLKLYGQQDEEQDLSIRLLKDIKRAYDETGENAFFTEELLRKLVEIADDAPWPDWFEEALKREKIQSAASKLAYQLRPYRIKPKTVRKDDETGKGYSRDQFEKAWERYLTPETVPPSDKSNSPVTPSQNTVNPLVEKDISYDEPAVTKDENSAQPSHHKSLMLKDATQICDDVTAKMQENRGENISGPKSDQSEQPEKRLGHLPIDQMMDEIRQHFPSAKILPPDNPEPEPPPDLGPELPF